RAELGLDSLDHIHLTTSLRPSAGLPRGPTERPRTYGGANGAGHATPPPCASSRRFLSSPPARHCSAALIVVQRPISTAVPRHPIQYPRSSSEQILLQGERGRSHSGRAGTSDIRVHYEAGPAMFKPRSHASLRGMSTSEPDPAPGLIPPADLPDQVEAALREDIGSGDVTAELVPERQRVRGRVVTRDNAVLCGRPWAEQTRSE